MPATSPEQLSQLFSQAIGQGDLEAVMALYEPGAVFLTQSGELRSGTDAIRQQMAPFADMKPDFKINVDKVVSTGDIALMYNTWSTSNPSCPAEPSKSPTGSPTATGSTSLTTPTPSAPDLMPPAPAYRQAGLA